MDYLAVAEAGCEDQLALDKNCEGKGQAVRSILASDVKAASQSRVKILVIDAVPSAETVCDPNTRLLLDGVSDAVSTGMIVIMPRPLSTRLRPVTQQRTYFDVCRNDYPQVMNAEQKVFYGATTIEALPEIAVFSLMRIATTVDMPMETGDQKSFRETPNLAIIAARALTDKTSDALRKTFADAGLETRSRTTPGFKRAAAQSAAQLTICNQNQKPNCEYQIDIGGTFRIRYGLDPNSRNKKVLRIVYPTGVASTIPAQEGLKVDINIIAANPKSSLDIHETVVGPLTGGVNIANQIYAISNHLLVDEAPALRTWLDDVFVLLVASAAAGVAALIIITLAFGLRLWLFRSGFEVSENWISWSWSGSALVAACVAAYWSWNMIGDDFERGAISFSIVGALLAFAKAVFLAESVFEKILEVLFDKLWRKEVR